MPMFAVAPLKLRVSCRIISLVNFTEDSESQIIISVKIPPPHYLHFNSVYGKCR